jgi:hypothetical protein
MRVFRCRWPLRSSVTWGKSGPHSGYRHLADKDEGAGSSPARPTNRPVTSGNAGPLRLRRRLNRVDPVFDEVLRALLLLSRNNAFEQPLCGPSVVSVPQVGGRTAVPEPIPVSWTVGWIPSLPVSAKGADCRWPHRSRTGHDSRTLGGFRPGPVRIAVTCDQGTRGQLLDLLQGSACLFGPAPVRGVSIPTRWLRRTGPPPLGAPT